MKELIERCITELPEEYLYNEAGLQHELGYFLRKSGENIKFEYNIDLVLDNIRLIKKEMDLYIERNNDEKICIEIKFPTKGAYPRRMAQSIFDIFFLQQLLDHGFNQAYFLFISPLERFFEGKEESGIYSYFRKGKDLSKFSLEDIPGFLDDKEVKRTKELLNTNGNPLRKKYVLQFQNKGVYRYCLLQLENT